MRSRFAAGHWAEARELFVGSALGEDFPDFLTLPAYAVVLANERRSAGDAG